MLMLEASVNQLAGAFCNDMYYIIFLSCDAKFELQCPSECPSEKMAMTLGISSKTVKCHIKDIDDFWDTT